MYDAIYLALMQWENVAIPNCFIRDLTIFLLCVGGN